MTTDAMFQLQDSPTAGYSQLRRRGKSCETGVVAQFERKPALTVPKNAGR